MESRCLAGNRRARTEKGISPRMARPRSTRPTSYRLEDARGAGEHGDGGDPSRTGAGGGDPYFGPDSARLIGMVAAGKSADFVVLDANPLDDITNTRKILRVSAIL